MWDYNYNPQNEKDFWNNANIITQYNDIEDDEYFKYYHQTALLLAAQIDMKNIKDFESYVINRPITISNEEAWKHIHNKIKTIRGHK